MERRSGLRAVEKRDGQVVVTERSEEQKRVKKRRGAGGAEQRDGRPAGGISGTAGVNGWFCRGLGALGER